MMKLLSFIIPSYNCEQFLDICIPSMLNAEVLPELDIIIVNDGSKDGTEAVAQKYCDMYPESIRLISQQNKGHGGALNTGCAAAVGKYLKVIDADDWVETQNLPEYLRVLQACESDVVLTHYYTRNISNGEVKHWRSYPDVFGKNVTFADVMVDCKKYDRSLTFHGITYKTAFYQKIGFQLSEHVYYEDQEFATIPCCHAKTIMPLDLFIYDYRIGDVNQSVSDVNQLKRIGHTETVLNRMITEYEKLTLPEGDAARDYYNMKAKVLLLGYMTTVMLLEPDKKKGRKKGADMMAMFARRMPKAYDMAIKQYRVYQLMNLLHVSKQNWEKVLNSRLYNTLRHNHDFK
ncbi:MAG: glycosyltransferase family 2 protein [Oscillospiraceae bacterium]|nr:glycosyltransferase family 2 protein [Oscillospiraceae bacterium]